MTHQIPPHIQKQIEAEAEKIINPANLDRRCLSYAVVNAVNAEKRSIFEGAQVMHEIYAKSAAMVEIRDVVFQKIGEASMCWSETPAGVFESLKAEKCANDILDYFKMQEIALAARDAEILSLREMLGKAHELIMVGYPDGGQQQAEWIKTIGWKEKKG